MKKAKKELVYEIRDALKANPELKVSDLCEQKGVSSAYFYSVLRGGKSKVKGKKVAHKVKARVPQDLAVPQSILMDNPVPRHHAPDEAKVMIIVTNPAGAARIMREVFA